MRQILLSLITIIAVASMGAAGTYAGFVDTETSAGNFVQAGSLELQLGDYIPFPNDPSDGDPPWTSDEDFGEDPMGDSVTETWDHILGYPQGMTPGDYLKGQMKLQNWGTVNATGLDISCVNVNSSPYAWPSGKEKDYWMVIEMARYFFTSTSIDLLTDADPDKRIEDKDSDGRITLDDWEADPVHGLPLPPLGEVAYMEVQIRFDANASYGDPAGTPGDDSYAGNSTNMTLIFTLL